MRKKKKRRREQHREKGGRERRQGNTHAQTQARTLPQDAFCHPSRPVQLAHTIVPGCALELASLPGFSISWCLRRSLAENGQHPYLLAAVTGLGRLAAGSLGSGSKGSGGDGGGPGPHLLNPRGVLGFCP